MQCDRARELIGAYIDGELSGAERQAVAKHVKTCAACASLATDFQQLRDDLIAAGRETLPESLMDRVQAALVVENGEPVPLEAKSATRRAWFFHASKLAAALALACVLSSLATWSVISRQETASRLDSEIVTAHIRSLLQEQPYQVASSEQHTVKPWFTGRVDFAPEVKDLSAAGFVLEGGRLDYVDGKRVGVIVYKRRLHVINVFAWATPETTSGPLQVHSAKGFNLAHWTKSGVTYWAVSDLDAGELGKLGELM